MKDLTKDSIVSHLLTLAAPVAIGMFAQIAYQLVDLYFVTRLGAAATAGVSAAGNIIFVVGALTQMLGVGTVALIAQAVGRRDQADANLIFNQSMVLAVALGIATMASLYVLIRPYMRSVAADAATIQTGAAFLAWVLPGFALMFPMSMVNAALRGTGVVQAPLMIYMITVILNAILAPVLIAGWGTGIALGVSGAGLATTLSIVIGIAILAAYVHRAERYLTIKPELLRPRLDQWYRIVTIGLPASGELLLTFLSTTVVYHAIRDFGATAQAGFGIGSRVLQVILLPGIAIAFAAAPIAGQNFGARNAGRVRETFRKAAIIGSAVMLAISIPVQWRPTILLAVFSAEAPIVAVAAPFLQIMSWTLVAQALIHTCTSMFQGLGNMMPSLISSGMRFVIVAICAVWLATQPDFRVEQMWHLLTLSVALQAALSLWLLRLEFNRRVLMTDH